MPMPYPKQAASIHVEQLGHELCIYNWQRKEVHALNLTAARVWQQCDGQTSPAQIAQTLQAELDLPDAQELVWLTLDRLEKAHLLAEAVVKRSGRRVLSRRQFLKSMGVAAALLPVVHSIAAPGPVEAQSPTQTVVPIATATPTPVPGATATPTVVPGATATATPVPSGSQTFDFTGAQQQFIVTAGVTTVTIQAFGAQGGAGGVDVGGGTPGTAANGGQVTATIAVTPGQILFVNVGGLGQVGGSGRPAVGGPGGFNGGAVGGDGGLFGVAGGGGGGASDVRQGGSALANRVVVAGGGGGGGANQGAGTGGAGGAGGGTTGAAGANGNLGGAGGGGGTQAAGGAGGTGVSTGADGA